MANAPEITGMEPVAAEKTVDEKSRSADADIGRVERVLSDEDDLKDHMNFDRVDDEVAKYTSDVRAFVSDEERHAIETH